MSIPEIVKASALEPGKTYVIELDRDDLCLSDLQDMQAKLREAAPDCRFIIFPKYVRLAVPEAVGE